MGAPRTRGKVAEYFAAKPNEVVYVRDLMADLKFSKPQVLNAINNLRNADGVDIASVTAGTSYIFRGSGSGRPAKTAKPLESETVLFEKVGTTTDDRIIIRDADTRMLYVAVPL